VPAGNRERDLPFQPNLARYIVSLPSTVQLQDDAHATPVVASRTRLVYDGNPSYQEPPTTRDVTAIEAWDDHHPATGAHAKAPVGEQAGLGTGSATGYWNTHVPIAAAGRPKFLLPR
jgi:hypothetical protein